MEKKAARKTGAKKKNVKVKTVETSPWTEIAVSVSEPGESSPPAREGVAAASADGVVGVATRSMAAKKKKSLKTATAATKKRPKVAPVSSSTAKSAPRKKSVAKPKTPTLDITAVIAATEPKVELSPAFKTLAEPTLPDLTRGNRARLMMQTPAKLYFYWSVRENPYHLLRKAFGSDMGSYTLVLKLTELNRGVEEIHRVEPEGNWWFNVEPDGKYEAEIGFYAPNRPYFRVIYSNTVETPRRSPSRRVANDTDWRVSATKFAEVLDVAGFSQDALDVAMAGDDHESAEYVTHTAFKNFIGRNGYDLGGVAAEDIRYSMTALAAGTTLEDLKPRISAKLFAVLQANAEKIAAHKAVSVLNEYFDIDESEFTEHQYGSAVHGASLVNFPRTLKTRVQKYSPVGSHSFR